MPDITWSEIILIGAFCMILAFGISLFERFSK